MWKRIIWNSIAIVLIFFAPWWVTLIFGITGVVFFSWYLEIIFLGVAYDVFFGGIHGAWYYHLLHTTIFIIPLLVVEFVKTRINTH